MHTHVEVFLDNLFFHLVCLLLEKQNITLYTLDCFRLGNFRYSYLISVADDPCHIHLYNNHMNSHAIWEIIA